MEYTFYGEDINTKFPRAVPAIKQQDLVNPPPPPPTFNEETDG